MKQQGILPLWIADLTLILCRFLYVIQFYIGNGFYVAIDFHGQGDGETDRQIVANSTIFQSNWIGLLTAIQSLPKWQDGTMKGAPLSLCVLK